MKPIRTLVVDDNPRFISAVVSFLKSESRIEIVGQAQSGRDALDQVLTAKPDLVLLDYLMPDMTGLEVLCEIKDMEAPPRVVIVTMHNIMAYRIEARKRGADGYVIKDEIGAKLMPLIEKLFDE